MKPLMWVGAFLVALGILGLLAQGDLFRYMGHTQVPHGSETQITIREEKVVSMPATLAGLTLAAGAGLMIVAARK